jgi:hypothetical protein
MCEEKMKEEEEEEEKNSPRCCADENDSHFHEFLKKILSLFFTQNFILMIFYEI